MGLGNDYVLGVLGIIWVCETFLDQQRARACDSLHVPLEIALFVPSAVINTSLFLFN